MSDIIKDGGPAFPNEQPCDYIQRCDCGKEHDWTTSHPGMSLRDWFAGMAIHTFSIDADGVKSLMKGERPMHEIVAKFCYGLADAMLAEREKTK